MTDTAQVQVGRRWASVRDAAKYYGSSEGHIRKLVQERTIPSYLLSGKVLVDLDEVDALILNELRPMKGRSA
jgi:excisionase family DNA binding protein